MRDRPRGRRSVTYIWLNGAFRSVCQVACAVRTQEHRSRAGDVLQHGHHHPQHLAEQRFTGARRKHEEISLTNPDETQKDAAILLGPSRPVGKSFVNCRRDSFHTEVPVQIWPS